MINELKLMALAESSVDFSDASSARQYAPWTAADESEDFTTKQRRVRHAVNREEFTSWATISAWRATRDLLLNWGVIVVALWAVSLMPAWWMYAISFLVIGSCQYGLFILAHDGLHRTLHPHRQVNDRIVRWLIYGPMFMGLEDARRNHLEHHQTLSTEADPDRYIHTLGTKNTPFKFLLFCSGLATFGKTVLKVTPFGMLLKRDEAASQNHRKVGSQLSGRGALLKYAQQRIPVAIAQALIIAAFMFSGLPIWAYILLWIAPIYFSVFLPDEIRAFCEHAVLSISDRAGDSHRLITFCPSRLEARIISPHNMNYHAEHHLWPGIPYYNLPKAHRFVQGRPEVIVRRSYLTFIFIVLRSLSQEAKAGGR